MRMSIFYNNEMIEYLINKNVNENLTIKDSDNNELFVVISNKNVIKIISNEYFKIVDQKNSTNFVSNFLSEIEIKNNTYYIIRNIIDNFNFNVYVEPMYDSSFQQLFFVNVSLNEFYIGNSNKEKENGFNENLINISNEIVSYNQIRFEKKSGCWYVINLNPRNPLYINSIKVNSSILNMGDDLFFLGIRITFVGMIMFLINNPNDCVTYVNHSLNKRIINKKNYSNFDDKLVKIDLYSKSDYFQRPPRFIRKIEPKTIIIESPPGKQDNNSQSLMTILPMMLMGLTSIISGVSAFLKVISHQATFLSQLPTISISIVMMVSTMIFPLIMRVVQKFQKKKRELYRQKKYKQYIDKKRIEIQNEIELQREILYENNKFLVDCANIILKKDRVLWERKIEHEDFLTLKLGLADIPPDINLKFPEDKFTLDEDILTPFINQLKKETLVIKNAPLAIDLIKHNILGIMSDNNEKNEMIKSLLVRSMTNCSYDNLKICVFLNESKKDFWELYYNINHFWNNDKTMRYVGCDMFDINQISTELHTIFNNRIDAKAFYNTSMPYYLIIVDDIISIKNISIVNDILDSKINVGFSIIFLSDKVDNIPNQTNSFIELSNSSGKLYFNQLLSNNQIDFVPEYVNFSLPVLFNVLSNIPVDVAQGKFILPSRYGFLEMFNVGNISQLNSLSRWSKNDVIKSLQAPVGIDEYGNSFIIDLHEKVHGPHGLVAGMTGSGKSEWIITYVLSMAINYSPEEVQFVLIDYKGGGLAGVFENKETGVILPHLIGTITNLDVNEINRSLASIESELKRRQRCFNEARDALGESSIDIYKYQKLYREKKVKMPISHLFIISDEFAELKSQQPEFMAQLISTARIGRSLGVHLILCTQKPNGVVDDQIWSNARFRVCLKVQEKADSNDMIKVPDAAFLKDPGRFYLQVGYNEFFAKGQAAYAGGPYFESDKKIEEIDDDIEFVNDVGYCYKSIELHKDKNDFVHKGDIIPNVLKYLIDISKTKNFSINKLWLDKIPSVILNDDLYKKYKVDTVAFVLNPIIGEYDAPHLQKQAILTMPLSSNGNALIYGMTGSGKENLLINILYSLVSSHSSKEVNIYILDFGAEVLNCFRNFPHVGDYVVSNEEEKINNLFKLLKTELDERRKLFQNYNGNIFDYCKSSGNTVPNLLIIINNIENLNELYPDLEQELISLTRDGTKYGILFVFTTNSPNGIKYKLSQNFSLIYSLQLNDKPDYISVLGNTNNVYPSKIKGRGIVKIDRVYEFQSAIPTDTENLSEFINEFLKSKISNNLPIAKRIPVLPEIVDLNFVSKNITSLDSVPIGVDFNNLNIITYNFSSKLNNIISCVDVEENYKFIYSLLYEFSMINNYLTIVVDCSDIINSAIGNLTIIKSDFANYMNKIISFSSNKKINIIIVGIWDYINKINDKSLVNNYFESLFKFNSNVIIIDNSSNIKRVETELWFKNCFNTNSGIWLGNGIVDQYSLKISKITSELREDLPVSYGFYIERGRTYKMKLLDFVGDKK